MRGCGEDIFNVPLKMSADRVKKREDTSDEVEVLMGREDSRVMCMCRRTSGVKPA